MPGQAAQQTRNTIAIHRQLGMARKPRPRKRLPIQRVPKTVEREYARALLKLTAEIREVFAPLLAELPALLEGHAEEMRVDAGEINRVKELLAIAQQELSAKLNATRLEEIVATFGKRTSDLQKKQIDRQIKAALGVEVASIDLGMGAVLDGFIAENVSYITKMSQETLNNINTTVTRGMRQGLKAPELGKQLRKHFAGDNARARRVARDQIGSVYGQINAQRQKSLGVTEFYWRTVGDDAVREAHVELANEKFKYSDPPSEGLPGQPINCRCWAEPVFDDLLGE